MKKLALAVMLTVIPTLALAQNPQGARGGAAGGAAAGAVGGASQRQRQGAAEQGQRQG